VLELPREVPFLVEALTVIPRKGREVTAVSSRTDDYAVSRPYRACPFITALRRRLPPPHSRAGTNAVADVPRELAAIVNYPVFLSTTIVLGTRRARSGACTPGFASAATGAEHVRLTRETHEPDRATPQDPSTESLERQVVRGAATSVRRNRASEG